MNCVTLAEVPLLVGTEFVFVLLWRRALPWAVAAALFIVLAPFVFLYFH